MRIEYVEWTGEEEVRLPPRTFWQRVWFVLNMDVMDIWRMIWNGITRTRHHRAG